MDSKFAWSIRALVHTSQLQMFHSGSYFSTHWSLFSSFTTKGVCKRSIHMLRTGFQLRGRTGISGIMQSSECEFAIDVLCYGKRVHKVFAHLVLIVVVKSGINATTPPLEPLQGGGSLVARRERIGMPQRYLDSGIRRHSQLPGKQKRDCQSCPARCEETPAGREDMGT